MKPVVRIAMLTMALSCLSCGGEADVGEECDEVGSRDACVSGAVCTDDPNGTVHCRVICQEDGDCPASQSCDSVSGTPLFSCQPR